MLPEPTPSIAGGNGSPIALDAALKHAESVLEHEEFVLPARFAYRWRGFDIAGEVARHGDDVVLRQAIKLCVLPYSAEDAHGRARIAALLHAASWRESGRFSLTSGQHVAFVVETRVEQPLTGPALTVACVRDVLVAMPYLRLIRH